MAPFLLGNGLNLMTHSFTPLTPTLVRAIKNLKRAVPNLRLPKLDHEIVASTSFRGIAEPIIRALAVEPAQPKQTAMLKVLQSAAEGSSSFDRSPVMRSGWFKLAKKVSRARSRRGRKRNEAVISLVKTFARELRINVDLEADAERSLLLAS